MTPPRHRIPFLGLKLWFPDPRQADRDGLLAAGGDLSPERLLLAYRSGIFPWTYDPITWWSPDPRAVFEIADFHVPRRLERTLRQGSFTITFDQAFRQVMSACAEPRPSGEETWISPEFIDAYTELHRQGHAHSVEAWLEGRLVGGVYGVAVGGLFAGESMFHRVSNASRAALSILMRHLQARGFHLFDSQVITPATERLGVRQITRDEYLRRLAAVVDLPVSF
ncbi:MAG TPA: leucyl/phenylalanyl-tRNA--protein transferase [Candidatus Ozemobacteraceae bacterium]|nr:leucyl/phenylalanyl-tRNA--protein transferase [Candidatus Ozemobacteraceae bacterium]